MIAVVQRVTEASVDVNGETVGRIAAGLAVLVSVEVHDTNYDAERMADRLLGLRIFPAGEKAYDLTVSQIGGALLVISNFTIAADTGSGRRPSLSPAAKPEAARPIFEHLLATLRLGTAPVATGRFGEEMRVSIVNDGPCTFILKVGAGAGAGSGGGGGDVSA